MLASLLYHAKLHHSLVNFEIEKVSDCSKMCFPAWKFSFTKSSASNFDRPMIYSNWLELFFHDPSTWYLLFSIPLWWVHKCWKFHLKISFNTKLLESYLILWEHCCDIPSFSSPFLKFLKISAKDSSNWKNGGYDYYTSWNLKDRIQKKYCWKNNLKNNIEN